MSDQMKTTWMDYSYVTSGWNLCNEATSVCRSLGHWVFTVAPKDISHSVIVGAQFKVDDGEYVDGGLGKFEAHFVNGQCADTSDETSCEFYDDGRLAQVWNIGYDVIRHGTAESLALPGRVCAKVWMTVLATGEIGGNEELCAEFPTATFNIPPSAEFPEIPDMMYSLSADAVSYICNGASCRSDGHVSFDVQVPDPTHELVSVTEYSIDGAAWTSSKTNTFFEQKVKHQNNKWYHTISWNYDDIAQQDDVAPQEICFKIWVQNLATLKTWWLDFGDELGSKDNSNVRCLKFCEFAMPFSYAPSAGGYCPDAPPILVV